MKELAKYLNEYCTGRCGEPDDGVIASVCLTGKDADLEPGGEQWVNVRLVEGGLEIEAHLCTTEAGIDVSLRLPEILDKWCSTHWRVYERIRDEYLDQAQEAVIGAGLDGGEWDGDSWVFHHVETRIIPLDSRDPEELARYIVTELAPDMLERPEREAVLMSDTLNYLAGWRTSPVDGKTTNNSRDTFAPGIEWAAHLIAREFPKTAARLAKRGLKFPEGVEV